MGKPTTRFTWATNSSYVGGPVPGTPTQSAPSSTEQQEGFYPGARPTAQLLGALYNNVFSWIAYLDENRVDGSLAVGGAPLSFTSFTFTATSGTPGLITATAHGRQTGDGPVRVSNSGGGLPGGLAAGTDYWVIVVGVDTLRLATSRANALSSVPVTLSSNGTGTQTLAVGTGCVRLGDVTVTRNASVAGTLQTGGKATIGGLALSVPSFVFTASSVTDKLTATDHGLLTGDGPVQVSNSGGALPTGLAAVTNYWAIVVDTNNVKLATSFTNAIAGIAIDLTTNGTGTQTLACTASTVRPADAEVTRSLTVDGDVTVVGALTVGTLHHDTTNRFVPRYWIVYGGLATTAAVPDPGSNLSPVWQLSTTASVLDSFSTSIDFVLGNKLAGLTVDIFGSTSPTQTYDLIVNYYPTAGTAFGSVVQLAHVSGITPAASWSTQTLTVDAPSQVLGASGMLNLLVKIHGDGTAGTRTVYIGNVSAEMVK